MLDFNQGALEYAIRFGLFGSQRFAEPGVGLVLSRRKTTMRKASETFLPRLHIDLEPLRAAFINIKAQANAGYDIRPAAEWLERLQLQCELNLSEV